MALNVVSSDRLSTNVKTSNLATGLSSKVGESKNLVINGACLVSQRSTSSTTSGYSTVDRFKTVHSGTDEAPTYAQVDVASGTTPYTSGFRKALKITNGNQTGGAGAADFISYAYRIEAQDIANSGWNYVSSSSYITLSFWIKSSVAQDFKGYIRSHDGTAQAYAFATGSLSAATWTKVTKTIPGNSNLTFDNNNDVGFELVLGGFWGTDYTNNSVTEDAWAAYASGTRMKDNTSTWYTTNDSTIEITGVQLEVGDTATEFEHRLYGDELRRCHRYCFKYNNGGGSTNNHSRLPVGYCSNTTTGIWPMARPPMRTTEGATLTHNIGTIEVLNNGNSQSSPTLVLMNDGSSETMSWMNLNLQSGRTQHSMLLTRVGGAQTDWYIIVSCEL